MASPSFQGKTHLERACKRHLLQYNTPRWLKMIDRISMANSVVCRSPLLDFRLVEFAFSLDNILKIRKGETKYIMREAKRDQLPASIVEDSHKIQLSGPDQHWLRGPLKDFALSLREPKNARLSAFLQGDVLRGVIDSFYQANKLRSEQLWRLLSSEAWLRVYF